MNIKKKIIATLFTVALATSAFLMGHATTATEKTMIAVEDNRLEYRWERNFSDAFR